ADQLLHITSTLRVGKNRRVFAAHSEAAHAAHVRKNTGERSSCAITFAKRSAIKLLLVEDASKLAHFPVRAFQEEGYVVDLCKNGADALAQAKLGVYDVIVLDWMLPDLDGIAVCRELRQGGDTTPILMLTARGELRERVLGLDAGADDYLVK